MFVSVTRLQLRSLRFVPQFLWTNQQVLKQLVDSPGFRSGKVLTASPREYWTVTLWSDEASMRKYRAAGAHLKAMARLADWCDEASVVHWLEASDTIPDWDILHRRMRDDGRRSRVNHPSGRHAAEPWIVPAPKWRLERVLKGSAP